ncbi:uncharacterized protein LOC129594903 [Paramacrobiotus metropolitanus]|uniref:uncharacterized protein LOC129594903 n=1 Tax=Paramacrobiotus metropolitanus TaxID=2943436 RepID=UPI002445BDC3|nr:uncharacterized protein LOC129594903 [Paramacrobiotus metropolitanus]
MMEHEKENGAVQANGTALHYETEKEIPFWRNSGLNEVNSLYLQEFRYKRRTSRAKFRVHLPLVLQRKRRKKPLSMNNLLNVYMPGIGAMSYQALSMHLVHKGIFSRFFGDRDLSIVNSLLYTSHIGIGLYIYNSPPVCFAASYNRLMYSVFGSVLFNFGSLLLWSTLRNAAQSFHPLAKIFLALSCATTLLFVGTDYMHFLHAWLRGEYND